MALIDDATADGYYGGDEDINSEELDLSFLDDEEDDDSAKGK